MTFAIRTSAALLALVSALPAAAQDAGGTPFMTQMTGAAQVPPVETEATGMADVRVDETAMTITWTVAYEGLSGEPVAAHFHGPASLEETAAPVIDLTVDMEGEAEASAAATATATTTEGTETATATETTEEGVAQDIMQGSSEITPEQLVDLRAGLWYVNVHTEANPDGEIRGQVTEGEADMEAMEAMTGAMEGAGSN